MPKLNPADVESLVVVGPPIAVKFGGVEPNGASLTADRVGLRAGDGGRVGGGNTLCRRARLSTSRRNVAYWKPGTVNVSEGLVTWTYLV